MAFCDDARTRSRNAILPRTTANDTVRNCAELAAYRLALLA